MKISQWIIFIIRYAQEMELECFYYFLSVIYSKSKSFFSKVIWFFSVSETIIEFREVFICNRSQIPAAINKNMQRGSRHLCLNFRAVVMAFNVITKIKSLFGRLYKSSTGSFVVWKHSFLILAEVSIFKFFLDFLNIRKNIIRIFYNFIVIINIRNDVFSMFPSFVEFYVYLYQVVSKELLCLRGVPKGCFLVRSNLLQKNKNSSASSASRYPSAQRTQPFQYTFFIPGCRRKKNANNDHTQCNRIDQYSNALAIIVHASAISTARLQMGVFP